MKKSPAELLREEFATRYGLDPADIEVEVRVNNVSRSLGNQILEDYTNEKLKGFATIGSRCGNTYPEQFNTLWVFAKDEDCTEEEEKEDALEYWQQF